MSADRETHRATRVEIYADWLLHDADGLAFNLTALPAMAGATAALATARQKLTGALDLIDQAIEKDRARNRDEHTAD